MQDRIDQPAEAQLVNLDTVSMTANESRGVHADSFDTPEMRETHQQPVESGSKAQEMLDPGIRHLLEMSNLSPRDFNF